MFIEVLGNYIVSFYPPTQKATGLRVRLHKVMSYLIYI